MYRFTRLGSTPVNLAAYSDTAHVRFQTQVLELAFIRRSHARQNSSDTLPLNAVESRWWHGRNMTNLGESVLVQPESVSMPCEYPPVDHRFKEGDHSKEGDGERERERGEKAGSIRLTTGGEGQGCT